MTIQKRIQALRDEMKKRGIDIYLIPTADFHESEYVGEYFRAREFMTGFTGSAGTAVILADEAGLWTDGRYFIQAERQLAGSAVTLYREAEEGVPKIEEFIEEKLKIGGCLGFDGRVVNGRWGNKLKEIAEKKQGRLFTGEDCVGIVWKDRPTLSKEPVFLLEEQYAGMCTEEKLAGLRADMKEAGADVHILTSLYDIAWLLNLRGSDIACVPVFLSFLIVTEDACTLFVQDEALDDKIFAYLKENRITVKPYDAVYQAAAELSAGTGVLLDSGIVNYRICESIPKEAKVIDRPNPTEKRKAVKNSTERANTKAAHIKDGIAVTKFIYWIKTNIGKIPITEISAVAYLKEQRQEQEGFLEPSFDTICAYGPNAAMMHYKAQPETDAALKPEGFLLVDSGGHYYEGTTDITRTIALGPLTEEMRRFYTAVCRANLNLADAKFLYGCTGQNLDILARGPLWDMEMDYRCGTGHGVGHILNVHEGPNGFRWKQKAERGNDGVLEEGMITTDEPGVYIEGAYGIRIENELLCKKAGKNEYGQFMEFENITFAPIDLDAIEPEWMSAPERERLNAYHSRVYETLAPYLAPEEREWLKQYTRPI